jgi:hypothetical protein
MLPLHSNRLDDGPAGPIGLNERDWARLLHTRRAQDYAAENRDGDTQTTVLVCQLAPLDASTSDPLPAAAGERVRSKLNLLLHGTNRPELRFEGLVYSENEGIVMFSADGRVELRWNGLEDAILPQVIPAERLYKKLRFFADVGARFYREVSYDGRLALDWTLVPRTGVQVYVESGHERVVERTIGQSLEGDDLKVILEPALAAIRRVAGIRGSAPDAWLEDH